MLAFVDTTTRVSRIDDDYSNGVLIRKSFNTFEISLPALFGKKVKVTDFEIATCRERFIVRKARSWKQNVSTTARKGSQHYFNRLRASDCEINIIDG